MQVFFTLKAQNALTAIVDFVESKNSPGSGIRFALKLESKINEYALENIKYALCSNYILAKLGYSCFSYHKWVIAFKIVNNQFIVYRIVWGPILK